MNLQQVKLIIALGLSSTLAVFVGYLLATGSYDTLLLLAYVTLGVFVLVAPGYAPLIALGLVCPFSTPIPFIYRLPFFFPILAICFIKYGIREWISHRRRQGPSLSIPLSFGLLFGWVLIRYCMDPILPNLSGFGVNATGFRSYLGWIVCFGMILFLKLCLQRREDILALIRWIGIVSLIFTLVLMPLVFTRSMAVAERLGRLGLYVAFFDNRWLRFVVLPDLGCTLIVLALFPRLIGWSRLRRNVMFGLGAVAVMMGGNRSSFLAAFILLLVIAWVRRRLFGFCMVTAALVLCLVAFRYIGDHFDFEGGGGFFRILSLTSRRVAQETGADATVAWRQRRWERALQDISKRPWIGHGYGGVENAFVYGTYAQFEDAMVEVDVASSAVHNGFLASARAFGIPSVLFFIAVYFGRIVFNAKRTLQVRKSDPIISDLHCFVFAYLAAMVALIYVGADLNAPIVWFYPILGDLIAEVKRAEELTCTLPDEQAELDLTLRPVVS